MALYQTTGGLMLGSRLKRLGDKYLNEVSRIYKEEGIAFEPSWFPLFYLLEQRDKVTVSDIARELEVSQSAVSQMILQLENKEHIQILREGSDKRVRIVSLTDSGRDLLNSVHPVWDSIQNSVQSLLSKGEVSSVLLQALSEFEKEMRDFSLSELVLSDLKERRNMASQRIVELSDNDVSAFRQLLFEHQLLDKKLNFDDEYINNPLVWLRVNEKKVYLIFVQDELLGYVLLSCSNSCAVYNYFLRSDTLGLQWFQLLVKYIFELAAKNNVKTIEWSVNKNALGALKILNQENFILEKQKNSRYSLIKEV